MSAAGKDSTRGEKGGGAVGQTPTTVLMILLVLIGAVRVGEVCFVRLIVFLHETLVGWGIRGGDLVVEESGEDEADARAAGATDVGEHGFEGGHGHGDDEAEDDNHSGDGGEAYVAHLVRSWAGGPPW